MFFQVESILIEQGRKAAEEGKTRVDYQQVSEMKTAISQFEIEFEESETVLKDLYGI